MTTARNDSYRENSSLVRFQISSNISLTTHAVESAIALYFEPPLFVELRRQVAVFPEMHFAFPL